MHPFRLVYTITLCLLHTFSHVYLHYADNQCSICQKSSGGQAPKAPRGEGRYIHSEARSMGKGLGPVTGKLLIAFRIKKILHSATFSYTNCSVIISIACRELYSWRLETWIHQVLINLENLSSTIQSIATRNFFSE